MESYVPTIFVKLVLLSSVSFAYINIEQYCKSFDTQNFRPIICMLKNTNNGSSQGTPYPQESTEPQAMYPIYLQPPPPNHQTGNGWESDEDDADCSCDLNCYPMMSISKPTTNATNMTMPEVTYKCGSCGSSCWVKFPTPSNCSCAVPSKNSSCSCIVTCASFRNLEEFKSLETDLRQENDHRYRMGYPSYQYDDDDSNSAEDINCIFTISNLTDTKDLWEQRPYNCDCCKSTAAVKTSAADFVCICQKLSGLD